MKMVFLSDKVCWPDPISPTGYSTVGGFPLQMQALSNIFDETRIIIMERRPPVPPNLMHLQGSRMSVRALPEPAGADWVRKFTIIGWLFANLGVLWQEVQRADLLHIAVPGDLGGIAILIGLAQQKRMVIRHCGTWDQPVTLANHLLIWLLEAIADEKNIVFATGGSDRSPSARNAHIRWIFSTTLSQDELNQVLPAQPWRVGEPLRLITVGRLTEMKNTLSIINALPAIRAQRPGCILDVVGDGDYLSTLEAQVNRLGLQEAVTFHGNVSHAQVLEALSRAHIFVFPTRVKEGFPKAMLEALACGLPAIATRVSVIPELLKGGAGILLDDTSAPAVADAVITMTKNPGKLIELGILARQAAQGYTLDAWAGKIAERLSLAWGALKKDVA